MVNPNPNEDIQKAIRLSLQQRTNDTTTNRCTTSRSDSCRTSTATPSRLLNLIDRESKIHQPKENANMPQNTRPRVPRCSNTAAASIKSHGMPKSTGAVSISTLGVPRPTIPSHLTSINFTGSNKIPKNDVSNPTACNISIPPPPPLKRMTSPYHNIIKKRRRDVDSATGTDCAKNMKPKKKRKKRKKKKKNSYKQFLAKALRPKHTREEKMKIHVQTIKKSLGGGQIPKLDRL